MDEKVAERIAVPKGLEEISFVIPSELVREFKGEVRVVVRYPWLIGIPVPLALRPDVLKSLKNFDVFLTPKSGTL